MHAPLSEHIACLQTNPTAPKCGTVIRSLPDNKANRVAGAIWPSVKELAGSLCITVSLSHSVLVAVSLRMLSLWYPDIWKLGFFSFWANFTHNCCAESVQWVSVVCKAKEKPQRCAVALQSVRKKPLSVSLKALQKGLGVWDPKLEILVENSFPIKGLWVNGCVGRSVIDGTRGCFVHWLWPSSAT